MAQPLMALGVNTPGINTVGNYLGAQKAATDMKSEQINQAGAQQQQEAASLEHIAQLGFGVMGGKLDGPIDPKRLDTMITLLGPDNPVGQHLKENPELLRTITQGSAAVAAQSQDAQKFELAKQQFDLDLQKATADAQKARYQEISPGATLHDVTGQTPDFTAPDKTPSGETGLYQMYADQERAAGREPMGILDFQQASKGNGITITNPDGTTTQIGGGGGKAYDNAEQKGLYETGQTIAKEGRSATGQLATLSKMKTLLSDDKVYTGIGGDQVQQVQRAAVALGLANPDSVKDTESFNAMAKKSVLDLAGGSLGTGFSNGDRDYLDAQVPSIMNTKDGNLQLIDIMEKTAKHKMEIAKFAADYKKSHDGKLDWQFDDALATWAEDHPVFKDEASKADAADPSKMSDDELLKQLNLN